MSLDKCEVEETSVWPPSPESENSSGSDDSDGGWFSNFQPEITKSDKSFLCSVCNKPFRFAKDRDKHLLSHASDKASSKPPNSENSSENQPGLDNSKKSNLTDGKVSKTSGNVPLQCKICKKSFNRAKHLKSHEETHTKPHQCKSCSRRFTSAKSLRYHNVSNPCMTSSSINQCFQCNKNFTSAPKLVKHVRNKHWLPKPSKIREFNFMKEKGPMVSSKAAVDRSKPIIQNKQISQEIKITPQPTREVQATVSCAVEKNLIGGGAKKVITIINERREEVKNIKRNPVPCNLPFCEICDKCFVNSSLLEKHVQDIHGVKLPVVNNKIRGFQLFKEIRRDFAVGKNSTQRLGKAVNTPTMTTVSRPIIPRNNNVNFVNNSIVSCSQNMPYSNSVNLPKAATTFVLLRHPTPNQEPTAPVSQISGSLILQQYTARRGPLGETEVKMTALSEASRDLFRTGLQDGTLAKTTALPQASSEQTLAQFLAQQRSTITDPKDVTLSSTSILPQSSRELAHAQLASSLLAQPRSTITGPMDVTLSSTLSQLLAQPRSTITGPNDVTLSSTSILPQSSRELAHAQLASSLLAQPRSTITGPMDVTLSSTLAQLLAQPRSTITGPKDVTLSSTTILPQSSRELAHAQLASSLLAQPRSTITGPMDVTLSSTLAQLLAQPRSTITGPNDVTLSSTSILPQATPEQTLAQFLTQPSSLLSGPRNETQTKMSTSQITSESERILQKKRALKKAARPRRRVLRKRQTAVKPTAPHFSGSESDTEAVGSSDSDFDPNKSESSANSESDVSVNSYWENASDTESVVISDSDFDPNKSESSVNSKSDVSANSSWENASNGITGEDNSGESVSDISEKTLQADIVTVSSNVDNYKRFVSNVNKKSVMSLHKDTTVNSDSLKVVSNTRDLRTDTEVEPVNPNPSRVLVKFFKSGQLSLPSKTNSLQFGATANDTAVTIPDATADEPTCADSDIFPDEQILPDPIEDDSTYLRSKCIKSDSSELQEMAGLQSDLLNDDHLTVAQFQYQSPSIKSDPQSLIPYPAVEDIQPRFFIKPDPLDVPEHVERDPLALDRVTRIPDCNLNLVKTDPLALDSITRIPSCNPNLVKTDPLALDPLALDSITRIPSCNPNLVKTDPLALDPLALDSITRIPSCNPNLVKTDPLALDPLALDSITRIPSCNPNLVKTDPLELDPLVRRPSILAVKSEIVGNVVPPARTSNNCPEFYRFPTRCKKPEVQLRSIKLEPMESPRKQNPSQPEHLQRHPFQHDPLPRDPLQCDPLPLDPLQRDPLPLDPFQREPLQRDPLQRDPLQRDPLPRDPLQRDPLQRDPLQRDPLQRDPLQRDPLQRDPLQRDPLPLDPFQCEPLQRDPLQLDVSWNLLKQDIPDEDPLYIPLKSECDTSNIKTEPFPSELDSACLLSEVRNNEEEQLNENATSIQPYQSEHSDTVDQQPLQAGSSGSSRSRKPKAKGKVKKKANKNSPFVPNQRDPGSRRSAGKRKSSLGRSQADDSLGICNICSRSTRMSMRSAGVVSCDCSAQGSAAKRIALDSNRVMVLCLTRIDQVGSYLMSSLNK